MIFDRISKLKRREQLMMTFAGVAVLGALVQNLVVGPFVTRINDLNDQIKSEERALAFNVAVLRDRQWVSNEYTKVAGTLGISASPAETLDDLNAEIVELGKLSKVNFSSVETPPPEKGEGGYSTTFIVDVGSFDAGMTDLLKFLHDLRQYPEMLRVVSLNIQPGPADEATGVRKIKGSMKITKVMMSIDDSTGENSGG